MCGSNRGSRGGLRGGGSPQSALPTLPSKVGSPTNSGSLVPLLGYNRGQRTGRSCLSGEREPHGSGVFTPSTLRVNQGFTCADNKPANTVRWQDVQCNGADKKRANVFWVTCVTNNL